MQNQLGFASQISLSPATQPMSQTMQPNMGMQQQQNQNIKVQLNPNELSFIFLFLKQNCKFKDYYKNLFAEADSAHRGAISGKEAVLYFLKSGLPRDILKQIWIMSSKNNQTLNSDEFFIALKLISFAQNNIPITIENIQRNIQSPLPKINKDIQPPQQKLPQQQHQQVMPQSQQQPQLQPQQQNLQQPLLMQNNQIFELSEERKMKYGGVFNQIDVKRQGFIEQKDINQIFSMSQLPQDTANLIWEQVDIQRQGKLTKPQFIVAMSLVEITKMNIQLPKILPPPLKNFILQNSQNLNPLPHQASPQQQQQQNQPQQSLQMSASSISSGKLVDKYDLLDELPPIQQMTPVQANPQPQQSFNQPPLQIINQIDKIPEISIQQQQQQQLFTLSPEIKKQPQQIMSNDMINSEKMIHQEFNNLKVKQQEIISQSQDDLQNYQNLLQKLTEISLELKDENARLTQQLGQIQQEKQDSKRQLELVIGDINSQLAKNQQLKNTIQTETKQAIQEITQQSINAIKDLKQSQEQQPIQQQQYQIQQQQPLQQFSNDFYQASEIQNQDQQQYQPQQQQQQQYIPNSQPVYDNYETNWDDFNKFNNQGEMAQNYKDFQF